MALQEHSKPLPHGYSIRRGRKEDVDGVAVVERAAFGDHDLYPNFFFTQAVDIFGGGFLVADYESEVVGYIIAVFDHEQTTRGWILSLGVRPEHRERGVGSNLSARAEDFLTSNGRTESVLTVDPENTTALRLYRRRHYSLIDKLDGHFGPKGDRLLLGLPLLDDTSGP